MRTLIKTAIVAAVAVACSTAFADGFYVSPQIGIGGMDTKKSTTLTNYSLRGFAWRLDGGYLWAMQAWDFGAEVGFTDYANNKYNDGSTNNLKYQGHYFDLLGVAKYNIDANFNVFAKLGAAMVNQKTSGTYITSSQESKNRVKPELAIGGAYNLNKNVSFNVNIYHVFGTSPDAITASTTKAGLNKTASVSTLMVGVQYAF